MKTKKILSIKVTDEHAHDSKMLPELVDEIIDSDSITTIGKLLADDGAYDGNDIFRRLADSGILPCIKVRRNAMVKKTNHIFRNLAVIFQKNNLQEWKYSISYDGQRWIAETVLSL